MMDSPPMMEHTPIGQNQTDSPYISVIIVSYNMCPDLKACLTSLFQQSSESSLEVIVVDNNSSDGTSQMLAKHFPQVLLLRNPHNMGLTKGINRGLQISKGHYILLLDADTILYAGTIARLVHFLEEHSDAGIVAGRVQEPGGAIQETARNFPRPINALFGRQTFLSKLFPQNPFTKSYVRRSDLNQRTPFEVGWVAACCMMFNKSLVDQIGPFDEGFFVYWVDADWCMRAHKARWKVYCVPEARVTHIEQNQKGKRKSSSRILSFHRGAYRFYRKHYVTSPFHPMMLVALFGLGIRCAGLLVVNAFMRKR